MCASVLLTLVSPLGMQQYTLVKSAVPALERNENLSLYSFEHNPYSLHTANIHI